MSPDCCTRFVLTPLTFRTDRAGKEEVVETAIEDWEATVAEGSEWNHADVDIVVVDESDGNTIT